MIAFLIFNFLSCLGDVGRTVILQPDRFKRSYEAKEKIILRAAARVFREKNMAANVTIDDDHKRIDSDYMVSGNWRTKVVAGTKKINWKESELTVSVISEKHTPDGWELRRVLQEAQYDNLFSIIDLKIYEEMSRQE
ncbi:MAG TPA: hypothetical protein PKJ10_04025 [Smithella sp.]|nr:hypothetical protein [Smithella sp.]